MAACHLGKHARRQAPWALLCISLETARRSAPTMALAASWHPAQGFNNRPVRCTRRPPAPSASRHCKVPRGGVGVGSPCRKFSGLPDARHPSDGAAWPSQASWFSLIARLSILTSIQLLGRKLTEAKRCGCFCRYLLGRLPNPVPEIQSALALLGRGRPPVRTPAFFRNYRLRAIKS